MNEPSQKIKIAVSSCLLGNNVRYDGNNRNNTVVHQICSEYNCIAICPEAGSGLGTPRPALKVIHTANQFRVRGKTNPNLDVTNSLQAYANQITGKYRDICGYIVKSRSPSCGNRSTPWFYTNNTAGGLTDGIFTAQIKLLLPELPIIEETQLDNTEAQQHFVRQVNRYAGKSKGK